MANRTPAAVARTVFPATERVVDLFRIQEAMKCAGVNVYHYAVTYLDIRDYLGNELI